MDSSSPSSLLQVAYASDENYVPVMGVSLMSLLDKNRDAGAVHIYVLDDGISGASRETLETLVASYGQSREISFISAEALLNKVSGQLQSYTCTPGCTGIFSRIFLPDLLPDLHGRLLYIDCDTLVGASLAPLLSVDLQGKCAGMVQDCISREYLDIHPMRLEHYHNSGFMLMNLDEWRRKDAGRLLLKGVSAGYGAYPLPDQDLINMSLRDEIAELDFRYNFQSPFFLFDAGQLAAVYRQDCFRQRREEFAEAKRNVAIAHFSANSLIRPWYANSNHPWKTLYDSYYYASPWKDRTQKNYVWEKHYRLQHFLAGRLPKALGAAGCSLMQRVFMYKFYHNWGKDK